jgi:hypothetical protein
MAFLQTYGECYAGQDPIKIALGKDLAPHRIDSKTILLGKCTAQIMSHGIYVEGCPPVPSDIKKTIKAIEAG